MSHWLALENHKTQRKKSLMKPESKIIVPFRLALALLALNLCLRQQAEAASFSNTGSLSDVRSAHTATLLPNGTVLVTGGFNGTDPVASAELYDPATGQWTMTGSLTTARRIHTATLLPGGKVLVASGGTSGTVVRTLTCELYDPAVGTWTNTGSMASGRARHTATLLTNGMVL